MQAVGQLDEYDADVLDHGKQHLAIGLGLARLAALVGYLINFGNPGDQFGDLVAKLLGDLRIRGRCILDDVVQEPGCNRGVIQAQLGEEPSHFDAVG